MAYVCPGFAPEESSSVLLNELAIFDLVLGESLGVHPDE
jgi:hypothetical protein